MSDEQERQVDELLSKLNLDKTKTKELKEYLLVLADRFMELLYTDLEDEKN